MCALGSGPTGSSSVVTRTLQYSESGQPPPKRFEPQARQNVFELPSGGWYVWIKSRPSSIRIAADRMRTFTVPPPPESFLQLSQWQWRRRSGASVSSNATPPQRQLPRIPVISSVVPTPPRQRNHPGRGI